MKPNSTSEFRSCLIIGGAFLIVYELGHDVPLFLAENALHAVTLAAVIGWQHPEGVLEIEAFQLAALAPIGNPFEHLVLRQSHALSLSAL
jgi:hypothetical protein